MRRELVELIAFLVIASLVTLTLAFALPGDRDVVLHAYLLVCGGALLVALVAAIGRRASSRERSAFDAALARRPQPGDSLPQLERLQREVTLGVSTAYDLHLRLLPTLREISQARLERAGRQPGPETLGRWWELLRPDRPAPDDRFAPGIGAHELRALLDDLRAM